MTRGPATQEPNVGSAGAEAPSAPPWSARWHEAVPAVLLGLLAFAAVAVTWARPASPAAWLSSGALGGAAVALASTLRRRLALAVDETTVEPTIGDVDELDSLEMVVPPMGTTRALPGAGELAAFAEALSAQGEAWAVLVIRAVHDGPPVEGLLEALAAVAPDAPLRVVVQAPIGPRAIGLLARPADLELLVPVLLRHFQAAAGRALGDDAPRLRVGVALAPLDAGEGGAVALADRASRRDEGAVVYHDRASLDALRERDGLKRELRRALADAEIVAHYQPVVDARTLTIVGAEALVRWAHPEHGLLAPARFLPLVEDQGAMMDLTGRILGKACRRIVEWRPAVHAEFSVVVNASGAQVRDQWLVRLVQHVLDRSGVAPEALWFEVELADVRGRDLRAVRTLERLAWLGVRVVVDGIGTTDDIAWLSDLPVDAVKLDARRLGMPGDAFLGRRAAELGQAAAASGRALHAKRVETVGQLAALRAVPQVERLQGFALAPPVQRSSFTALAASPGPFAAVGLDASVPGTTPGIG